VEKCKICYFNLEYYGHKYEIDKLITSEAPPAENWRCLVCKR